jgi:hypothetical protein
MTGHILTGILVLLLEIVLFALWWFTFNLIWIVPFMGFCAVYVVDLVTICRRKWKTKSGVFLAPDKALSVPKAVIAGIAAALVLIVIPVARLANTGRSVFPAPRVVWDTQWEGYRDFESYQQAAYGEAAIPEWIYELLANVSELAASSWEVQLVLSLLGEKVEILSGDELTEKYRVDPALRAANKFLVRKPGNGETHEIQAYNTGSNWVVEKAN